MENFPKYPNPPQVPKPPEQTPSVDEKLKSDIEKIAAQKLQKILDPNFKHFTVRFVHIAEYEEIMRTGAVGKEREVFIHADDESFSEYAKSASGKWADRAGWQTNWNFSTFDGLSANSFIEIIKSARKGAWKTSQLPTDGIIHRPEPINRNDPESQKTFTERVRSMVLSMAGAPQANYFLNLRNVKDSKPNIEQSRSDESRESEVSQVIQQFLEDDNFLDNRNNFRKLYTALCFTEKTLASTLHSQYHIGLVVDSAAIGTNRWRHPHSEDEWGDIRNGEFSKDALLAAICVIPNRDIVARIAEININLSVKEADLAHPVFDANSVVRWPKQTTGKT